MPEKKKGERGPTVIADGKHCVRKKLTHEEWSKRSLELAGKQAEIDELANREAAARSTAKVAKELRDALLEQISILARVIRDKEEDVLVDTETVANFETGFAQVKSKETGEIIEERPLTMEERQVRLL